MKNDLDEISAKVRLEEGSVVIEQLLLECYFSPGISTKELARRTLLPVPVAAAIKKELVKAGALTQENGTRCSRAGTAWIEEELGYGGVNRGLYLKLTAGDADWKAELADVLSELQDIFRLRPQVDVRIDQSKCTAETSLRRAVLCLKQHALIGKRVLCIGDDDLVSVSLGLLLRKLFPKGTPSKTRIDVVDIDERFLSYIAETAAGAGLPIQCRRWDLRQPLAEEWQGQYDCFFTDPPYTLQGMTLFLSRGISGLKKRKGALIFLSFAHKSPEFMLAMQREFVRMGLMVSATFPRFNEYEGAEMIANRSQMIVLKTTEQTRPEFAGVFEDALYTGEVKRTLRIYRCQLCGEAVYVGFQGDVPTIEQLKNQGCPRCKNDTFQLIEKKSV
ncbi:bis-aminopropyl spermidine synthase family protein [Paenibacillus ehimensis]|uniref:bis-aminopropyl spermidine synthase family protein n=1 Tax=Paenibacillus ehimensis TaxID=79264 RepID=UPI003D2AFF53